jgi:photosystem II stability/assembly factor-like uncharacterized protein
MRRAWEHKQQMLSAPLAPEAGALQRRQSVPGDKWINIGPAPINKQYNRDLSGRIRAVVLDGSDPNGQSLYIGAAGGGVWKTTDDGAHWAPMSDFEASLAIGTLALDTQAAYGQSSRIIYAGTGELLYGAGILRSHNGGQSWMHLGASVFDKPDGGAKIRKIALDPTLVSEPLEQRIVYVAADQGLYRSTDSGHSWQRVLRGIDFTDIVIDPTNPAIVYAAHDSVGIWRSDNYGARNSWSLLSDQSIPPEFPASGFARINLAIIVDPGTLSPILYASMEDSEQYDQLKGIWRSLDDGVHWDRVTGHPPTYSSGQFVTPAPSEGESNDSIATANPVPVGQVINGTISSPTDEDYFEVTLSGNLLSAEICADRAGTGLEPRLSIYKLHAGSPLLMSGGVDLWGSKDERAELRYLQTGTFYVKVESTGGVTTGDYQLSVIGIETDCQCSYDQVIAVEPGNPEVLYMGQVDLHRSMDGGTNWSGITHHGNFTSNWMHVDIHAVAFDPNHPQTMYWGTDGGIWKTTDRGDHWINLNTDLSITQPYQGISQHPTDPDFMLIGTQDNGIVKYENGSWVQVRDGDGTYTAIIDDQKWFYAIQRLDIWWTKNNLATLAKKLQTGLGRTGVPMVAPFILDPTDPNVLLAGGGVMGSSGIEHRVYRMQLQEEIWLSNSPALGDRIYALAISPWNNDVYYAGLWDGRVRRTTDGGTSWGLPPSAPIVNLSLTDVAVHPTEPDTAYATFSGFGAGHVYRTINGGGTWVDISGTPGTRTGLPDCPVNAIVVDPNYPNTIFIGTDIGIFRTTDGGVNWAPFDYGLPNVQVLDLILSTTTGTAGKLRAGTHGRGVWELAHSNNSCAEAAPMTDGIIEGTTLGAGTGGDTSCGVSTYSPDLWYRYTATCDGELRLDTCGSSFDTVVSVHHPDCSDTAGQTIACNDDCLGGPCGGPSSCLTTPVETGQEVLIRVSGQNGASGDFTLSVACENPGDACEDAAPLPVPSETTGSTEGANEDGAPICGDEAQTAPGVWYTVTGTGTTVTASLCSASTTYDSKLSVYCGECGDLSCVAANNDFCGAQSELSWCAAPGIIYHVLVHGQGSETGDFELILSEDGVPCTPTPGCGPANEQCEAAAQLPSGGTFADNTGASTQAFATCQTSNSDIWYHHTPACNGFLTVDTCAGVGTLSDTVLSVWSGCGGMELACNDDAPECGLRSKITMPVQADLPLWIRGAGYGGGVNQGTFPVSVSQVLAPLQVAPPGLYIVDGHGSVEDHLLRLDAPLSTVTDVGSLGRGEIAALAYVPHLGLMYAVEEPAGEMVTIDLATGVATPFGMMGFPGVRALAYDTHANRLYGVETDSDVLVRIDPFTGVGEIIGPLSAGQVEGLAFDPDGWLLYGSNVATGELLIIDTDTGLASPVGLFGAGFEQIEGLAFDSTSHTLYGVHNDPVSGIGRVVRIDPGSGAATQIGPYHTDLGPNGLALVPGLSEAVEGKAYSDVIPVAGGCPFYIFTDPTGLPPELSMDANGKISGIPTVSGTYVIDFTLTDSNLSTPSVSASIPLRIRPASDSCADPLPVGDGEFGFTNVNATTDGPDEPGACDFFGYTDIESDIWYCYTAQCTGTLTADLCASSYDTKVAIYEGCGCPEGPSAMACNDDACGTRSALDLPVVAGQTYQVRIGGYRGEQGAGTVSLTCAGVPGGGCCLGTGCVFVTEAECTGMGGSYLGDETACTPDTDGDLSPDACDGCPTDSYKTDPGVCGCGSADFNTDGDGAPDCVDDDDDNDRVTDSEDQSPQDPMSCRDADGDGCDDCSSGLDDPANDGTDGDADGFCAVGDCDDGNPDTHPGATEVNDGLDNHCPDDPGYGLVDEISGLAGFFDPADPTRYSWPAQSGAVIYEVARASTPDMVDGCETRETPNPFWNDSTPLSPGDTFFYLVRPRIPHLGSWGRRSDTMVERFVHCSP